MPPTDVEHHEPDIDPLEFRARLIGGDVVVGMMVVAFFTPALPRVLAHAGADFAVFDMESTGLTFERFEMLATLSHAVGLAPLIRVPVAAPSTVGRCLDLGAVGVMAPKIRDVHEAEEFARSARFPPDGVRGSGYRVFPDGYVRPTSADERTKANTQTVTVCQLETEDAIAQADRIVAVPGIDVVNVGANDLAAELGLTTEHPHIRKAIDRVRNLCVTHGKVFGGRVSRTEGNVDLPTGHRLVLIDHDTAALSAHTRAGVAALRKDVAP